MRRSWAFRRTPRVGALPQGSYCRNQTGRDFRIMKLERRTSGQCRSKQGAKDFAALRSVLSMAREQDLNCIAILTKEKRRLGSWPSWKVRGQK